MTKKMLTSLFIFTAVLSSTNISGNVYAKEKSEYNDITSIQQLDEAVESAKRLKSNEKSKVINEIIDEMSPSLKKELFSISANELNISGEGVITKNITKNIQVFSSAIDEEDNLHEVTIYNPLKPSFRSSETKAYGNRKYTGSHGWNIGGIGIRYLKLVNHYKVDSKGLTMTSVDDSGTTLFGTYSFKGSIPDKYAEKVGYDMNGRGTFTTSVPGGYFTITGQINSTIKLSKWDKKNKKVTVSQSAKYSE